MISFLDFDQLISRDYHFHLHHLFWISFLTKLRSSTFLCFTFVY